MIIRAFHTRGGVLTTTSKEIRLKAKTETGTVDQSSSVLQFTMSNKSVVGYIGIQDELGNLYDMRPINIQLAGGALPPEIGNNLIPIGILAVGAIAGVAIAARKRREKKST